DQSASANITLKYVRPDGTTAATTSSSGIEANGSLTFFGSSAGVTEGFNGAVVITSNTPIVVIANQLSQDTGQSGSYNGVSAVGKSVYVPAVQRGGEGGHTSLYIQNAGSAATSRLSVKFFRVNESAPVLTRTLSAVPAGAAVELAQGGLTDLPDGFRGSAVVESDQDLAVVVNQSNGKSLLASSGRPTGSASLYGPLVMNNNGGFNSAVQVQNVGTAATPVTINVRNARTGAALPAQTRTLAPGAATSGPMSELAGSDRLVGSVVVSAASGGSIIGVVNQVNAGSNQGSAYSLFSGGSSSLVAPLVQTANSGWNSGFQVQNIGTSNATVTLNVVDTGRNPVAVPDATQTLAPGQSFTWFPITSLGTRMVGAATVTGSEGSVLVGVANQLNQDAGAVDYFMTYEAVSQ
ncbi:MAG: hypothetical protein HY329_00980, partial [Chloroflexi bacterium]|nr:hypothetical protein [Chloroflexota bacterium]